MLLGLSVFVHLKISAFNKRFVTFNRTKQNRLISTNRLYHYCFPAVLDGAQKLKWNTTAVIYKTITKTCWNHCSLAAIVKRWFSNEPETQRLMGTGTPWRFHYSLAIGSQQPICRAFVYPMLIKDFYGCIEFMFVIYVLCFNVCAEYVRVGDGRARWTYRSYRSIDLWLWYGKCDFLSYEWNVRYVCSKCALGDLLLRLVGIRNGGLRFRVRKSNI